MYLLQHLSASLIYMLIYILIYVLTYRRHRYVQYELFMVILLEQNSA